MFVDRSGNQIAYTLLRITPNTQAIQAHIVKQGDRLDLMAFTYYNDPEQFWRICDGNSAMRPDDLTATIGRSILIPIAR
jgi:hypothetical protein